MAGFRSLALFALVSAAATVGAAAAAGGSGTVGGTGGAFAAPPSGVPSSKNLYQVTYTTGNHVSAGSEAPMYIQISGQYGSTPYLKLNTRFQRDATETVALYVEESLGPLMGISIKADTLPPFDSWNAVNFIDIEAPDGEVAQFKTDFTVSGKPEVKFTDYGVVESLSEVYAGRSNWAQQHDRGARKSYKVGWQTGTKEGAGSFSRHFVQLVGSRARSRYYSLCASHSNSRQCFVSGAAQLAHLRVNEDIGELMSVEFVAGGEDGWNVVDFIEVRTPSQQSVQFKADFWLDSARHRTKPLAYGIYPYARSRLLRAINSEQRGNLDAQEQCPGWAGVLSVGNPIGEAGGQGTDPTTVCCPRSCGRCGGQGCEARPGGADACCHNTIRESRAMCTVHAAPCLVYGRGYLYKVEFTTGSLPDAGTKGKVFVQLNGQRGSTNYHVIQHSGMSHARETFTITVHTEYNIGVLTGVTLSSSSEDGWLVEGKINIFENKYMYSVKAGWWLDLQPNTNKEAYAGKPHAAVHRFNGMVRTAKAATVSHAGPRFGARDSFGGAGSGHQHTGNAPTAHVATGAPKQAQVVALGQSKGKRWCQNGKIRVMENWWGPGDGHNACNRCSCQVNPRGDATFSCAKKSCGVWWRNEFVMGAVVCPTEHLSCKFGKGGKGEGSRGGRHRLRVFHKHKGMALYKSHRCGFDALAPKKPCTCICFDPVSQHVADWIVGRPEPLAVAKGKDVSCKWITFPKPFRSTRIGHAANVVVSATNAKGKSATAWVQATHQDKFEACVETDADKVEVSYFGFDMRHKTDQLRTGIFNFGNAPAGKVLCKTVHFDKLLARPAFIAGSVDMFSGEFHNQKEGLPVYHWLRDVLNDRFDVCVLATTQMAKSEEMRFSYVAADVPVAAETYDVPAYSEAGTLTTGMFDGTSCRTHTFKRKYAKPPTVLVSGEAYFPVGSQENAKPISTYLKQVTGADFTVCSTAAVYGGERQVRMHFLAFGGDVPAVSVA